MRCREPHINKTAVNMLGVGDGISQGHTCKLNMDLGMCMQPGITSPEAFPGKGLRGLHASAGATGRAHMEEQGEGCHLPVTVSPIMAGGAENVHLNEVVLQCP